MVLNKNVSEMDYEDLFDMKDHILSFKYKTKNVLLF